MKQTLKPFMLLFMYVFLLVNASNAVAFNIPDTSPTGASGEYDRIINAIRNNPHTSTFVNNIRQINASTSARSAFILSINGVHLVLRSRDLYLIGFVDNTGANFHHFSDVNPADVSFDSHQPYSDVNVTGTPAAHNIGFASDYTSLERTGNHERNALNINIHNILGPLRNIQNYVNRPAGDPQRTGQGGLASATLQTVVTFIEAARFGDAQLADRISTALWNGGNFNTNTTTQDLVTNWSRYYNGIYNLVSQLNTFYAFFFDTSVNRDHGVCISSISTAGVLMALLGVQQAGGGSFARRDTDELQITNSCSNVFRPLDAMQVGKTYTLRLVSDGNCPMVINGLDLNANCASSGSQLKVTVASKYGNNFGVRIGDGGSRWLQRGSRYGLSSFYRSNFTSTANPLILRPADGSGNKFKLFYDLRPLGYNDECGLDWRPDSVLAFHCNGGASDTWSFRK